MSLKHPATPGPTAAPTAERFHRLFGRPPTDRELTAFAAAHEALALRLPARARRRAARVIVRL